MSPPRTSGLTHETLGPHLRSRVEKAGQDIVQAAKNTAGVGWGLLGSELQQALVARYIISRLLADTENGSLKIWAWIASEAYRALGREQST